MRKIMFVASAVIALAGCGGVNAPSTQATHVVVQEASAATSGGPIFIGNGPIVCVGLCPGPPKCGPHCLPAPTLQ
jgi:hypothetical protein